MQSNILHDKHIEQIIYRRNEAHHNKGHYKKMTANILNVDKLEIQNNTRVSTYTAAL